MKRRKILIVDDYEMNRSILKKMLGEEYEILEAENGKATMAILNSHADSISAVLLDLVMPQMDGYEVLAQMRSSKALSKIPVIVTTGNVDEYSEVRALTLGANDYIAKPYNPRIIRHRLWNTINLRENAAALNAVKTDALTGLYTRMAFFEKVEEIISENEPGCYVMACFDINGFKVINDQYGNTKGDEVLKFLAQLFREGFEATGGICSRISADNFAILYPASFKDTDEIEEIRRKASVLDGSILPISFSVGRYIVDDTTLSPSAMYDRASIARESIKGRYDVHVAQYDESMRDRILQQQEIISEMNAALINRQFEIWFQPQFNRASGALSGAEALVRWRHSRRGLISPDDFIPVFEKNGFVYEMDKYVWEETCILLRKWLDADEKPVPVSVNVSRYDVLREDVIDVITGLISKYDIPVDLLRLEITETAFAKAGERVIEVVRELKTLGFIVEIDDFGSGYSSLNTLKDVPADVLKLDMKFLEGNNNTNRGGTILESIVRMTKWLGMSVIAEGVETVEQADFLKSIGCNYHQGYLYAKPMPADEFEVLSGQAQKEQELQVMETLTTTQHRALIENLPCGAGIYEYFEGRLSVVYLNKRYLEMVEREVESDDTDILQSDALRVDDRERLIRTLQETVKPEEQVESDVHILHGSGEYRLFHLTGNLIRQSTGRIVIYATYTPVSEKEMSYREMIPVALSAMMAGASELIFVKDKNLTYICCSRAFARMVGLTDEREIVGKTDYDIFERKLAEKYRQDDCKLLIGNQALSDYVEHIPSQDGTIHYSSTSKYILRDSDKNVIGLYGVGRDITESREAYARLKLLSDNIPGGIAMLEIGLRQSRTLYTSDGIYNITEYPKKEYDEKAKEDILFVVFEEDRPIIQNQARELLKRGTVLDCTCRIKTKTGACRWVNVRGTPADREQGRVVVNAVLFDVTDKKNTEIKMEINRLAMEMASQNGNLSFWLYNLDTRTISQSLFENMSSLGYPEVICNVPECFAGTGQVAVDDEKAFLEMHAALLNGAQRSECTVRMLNHRTGKYEWQHIIYSRLSNSEYETNDVIGFSINVDLEQENRQRYEHELRLRQELIRNSIFYYQLNLTTGIIEEYHSKYAENNGMGSNVKVNNAIRQNILDKVYPEDAQKVADTLWAKALKKAYRRGERTISLVYRRQISNLGYRWIEASGSIIEKPDTGELLAFLHSKDIDKQKKDQLAIESIMDEEIESVIVINVSSGVAHMVQIKADFGGLHAHQSFEFDREFERIVCSQVLKSEQEMCRKFFNIKGLTGALEHEAIVKLMYRVREKHGAVHRKKTRAFYLDDTHEEIVLIRRDITDLYEEEQRQKKALQEAIDEANSANRAKSDFLSNMSHDMRTPLNAVLAFSDIEMTENASEQQMRDYLGKIHSSGKYLLGIINDVLDMSKIEQKKVVLSPEAYSLNEFVETINTVIGELCRNKKISFLLDDSKVKKDVAIVDRIRFNQIFINLLSNAVKFTPEGGKVELIVENAQEHMDEHTHIIVKRFMVRDNGIGMSREFIPHAFESFKQEYRKGISEKNQGTGLGLSIVKELVHLMQGEISIESEIGKGTTFTIELPLKMADAAQTQMDGGAQESSSIDGMKILLCEDNEINAEIAIALLEKQGCIVECAENGKLGLEKYLDSEMNYYDAILMDIRMPVMNGLEASKAIREANRMDAGTIPIIALTADAFNEDQKISKEAGMNAHLSKPINPRLLYKVLGEQRQKGMEAAK